MGNKENLDKLRDCVKQAFLGGCERGPEFNKMRHAIISELNRLGYDSSEIKSMLLEWNKRCEKPVSLSEQKIQLFGYVDWFFKKGGKTGCKALEDYCIGKERCKFYLRITHQNRQQTKELPFDMGDLDKFLTERFKANGYVMLLVVKALRYIQQEKATGETIFVGYRAVASVIRDKYGHNFGAMDIFRRTQDLRAEGVLEQIVKGKSGHFTKQSNGYRFLAWRHP